MIDRVPKPDNWPLAHREELLYQRQAMSRCIPVRLLKEETRGLTGRMTKVSETKDSLALWVFPKAVLIGIYGN